MKTKFLLGLLFVVFITKAQVPIHDAIELADIISNHGSEIPYPGPMDTLPANPKNRAAAILSFYSNIEDVNLKNVIEHYKNNNEFIKPYIGNLPSSASAVAISGGASARKALSSFYDMDVTNVAIGLADFLIKRTKTELNTAFFKRFKKQLNEEENLHILFPTTVSVLSTIGEDIYQYNLYLNNLRAAFEKDLRGLLHNVPELVKKYRQDLEGINTWAYPSVALSIDMIRWVHHGYNPGKIIALMGESQHIKDLSSMTDSSSTSKAMRYAANSIRIVSLISESFRGEAGSNNYWTSADKFTRLHEDKVLRIYLGLLYQVSKKGDNENMSLPDGSNSGIAFHEVLEEIGGKWGDGFSDIRQFVTELAQQTNSIQQAIDGFQKQKEEIMEYEEIDRKTRNKRMFDSYMEVFSSTISLLEYSLDVEYLLNDRGIKFDSPEKARDLVKLIDIGGELSMQVVNHQYAGAVTNAALLLKKTLTNLDSDKVTETLSTMLKYGSFMVALVEAETPDQAKTAIEAAALPPGSFTIKRESYFNVALNGYLGGFLGREIIDGVNNAVFINNISLTAPVGVSVSWGRLENKENDKKNLISCLGLFFPILDLGTVASYRFQSSEEVESIPTIQLKDIIAPGMFFELGLGHTPISLGFGAQLGSRLRQIKPDAEANEIGDFYWRFGLSLKVDIPIINLHTRTQEK